MRKRLYVIFILSIVLIGCRIESEPKLSDLMITEIGATYGNITAWFEIYNNGNGNAQLSDFKIRSRGRDRNPDYYWSTSIQTFSLPEMVVYPGSYVVIKGKTSDDLTTGGKIAYILNPADTVPYWDETRGFLELLYNGNTIDFVRFGSIENTLPVTSSHWTGGVTEALPDSSPLDLGKSLARNGNNLDSNTPSDWFAVDYATPGGPNDATSNTDSDLDGIPDSSEVQGSTFAGLPLYDWGARAGIRDIFIHIDYMESSDPGVIPNETALNKVVDAFQAKDIAIHFDVGNLFHTASGTNLTRFDLDDTSHQVSYAAGVAIGYYEDSRANLYDYKSLYMDLARKQIFHYLLFANSQNSDGSGGSSGIAEFEGNDFIVSLGGWGLVSDSNKLINYQASTIMHELGHNLGLEHGGNTPTNYKPNYISIMNYLYQMNGLPTIGVSEGDRYLYEHFDIGNLAGLTNSPLDSTTNFEMDYSDGTSSSIDENHVNETTGLGRSGSGGVDYNNDDAFSTDINEDINFDGIETQTHTDFDDWSNINLFFQRYIAGDSTGSYSRSSYSWTDIVEDDRQPVYPEDDFPVSKYINND